LCGVLHYSVLQRRREIGIRLALGSGAGDVARRVTFAIFSMVLLGSIAGLALGLASQSYIETLLYDVTVNDPWMLALPWAAMIAVALLSALPAVINAVRTDPAITLRGE